jgi:hypothetical protein
MIDGGSTNTTTDFEILGFTNNTNTGSTLATFNLTGTGAGNRVAGLLTLTAFSVTSSQSIELNCTSGNQSKNGWFKLY